MSRIYRRRSTRVIEANGPESMLRPVNRHAEAGASGTGRRVRVCVCACVRASLSARTGRVVSRHRRGTMLATYLERGRVLEMYSIAVPYCAVLWPRQVDSAEEGSVTRRSSRLSITRDTTAPRHGPGRADHDDSVMMSKILASAMRVWEGRRRRRLMRAEFHL